MPACGTKKTTVKKPTGMKTTKKSSGTKKGGKK